MTTTVADPGEYSAQTSRDAVRRLRSAEFGQWQRQAEACGYCARPVRLVGRSQTVNMSTGEVVGSYDSRTEPDGVTYVRCGNRRASVCPSCSREYAGDMWHLIRAGAAGGDKGVPESVATHPKVFATLTAPSFGPVHAHKKPGRPGSPRCRPRTRKQLCRHGRPVWCMAVHGEDDPRVGTPLCEQCYDYAGHVVWQWWAGELWRRFGIALKRRLAAHLGLTESSARRVVRVQYVKVAEFQQRGVIHFHALIRLDGPPTPTEVFPAPACGVDAATLAALAAEVASTVWFDVPGVDDADVVRRLRFGAQLDARPITRHVGPDGVEVSEEAVAGYLAKYVTKAADDSGVDSAGGCRSAHLRRLSATVERLDQRATAAVGADGGDGPYGLLGLRVRTFGYRGHCSTKSRTYSTTMTALRAVRRQHTRRRAVRSTGPVVDGSYDLGDDDAETLVVVGSWQFAGMGWLTDGDATLAAMAADAARDYAIDRATTRTTARATARVV